MAIQNDSPVRTLPPDKIGELLCASLADDSVVFIFPTDVTATAWADWLVTHYETSGVKAVPLERFIAWDTFKTEFVAAHCPQKSSVPALLRKLFVRNVIAENERGVKNGSPVFRMLIAPAYADNAYAYTDWLSSLLPSLKRWHNAYERWQHLHAPVSADAEDEDYLTLYRLYTQYLAEHDLFEPAWQLPDFSGQGKTYILLYPELLDDYADYAETFAAVSSIVVYRLPEVAATVRAETLFPPVDFFSNARTELRVVALRILSLVASGAVSWNDIAVNVPDSITWRPYIEREFALYGIPYVIRSGTPLIKNTAGRIFKEIYDCYTAHFSYDSMRVLLLDDSVPWKAPVVNENLIRAGKEYACVCPYEERGTTIDVWERALSAANSGDTTARERAAYRILKNDITAFKDAQTFADVQSVWFQFRDDFLDAGAFTPSADLIIGRCLQELAALVDIEKNFLLPDGIRTVEPFQFFLNELSQKSYQEQQTHGGVSIFPYRLTAAAPFPVQFVVDASQKSLTVSRPSFWFLSPAKRALLGVAESKDATDAFIRLYAGKGRVFFSGATDTFTGFSIPQSFLQKPSASEQHAHIADILESLAPYDIAAQEQRWFLGKAPFPKTVGSLQAKGFAAWHKLVSHTAVPYAVSDVVARRIDDVVRQRRGFHSGQTDVTHITQTDLNHFFVCPRKWLFLCALRFEEDSLDAVFMSPFDGGIINHAILERFMNAYAATGAALPTTDPSSGLFPDEASLVQALQSYAHDSFRAVEQPFRTRPLVLAVLDSQTDRFTDAVLSFLHELCRAEHFGGWRVHSVERWFHGVPEQNADGWSLTGRIDTVLIGPEGKAAIIDYKSHRLPTVKASSVQADGTLADFQMAVYVLLWKLSDENQGHGLPVRADFWSIRNAAMHQIIGENAGRSGTVSADAYEPTLHALIGYADEFSRRLRSLRIDPTTETVRLPEACMRCPLRPVCRTTYTVSRIRLTGEGGNREHA